MTSIPAMTALVFVIVAVKVFRASMMETTTTVAIVSSADVFALLKGVILTLLPGFLAGLAAVSIWWWGGVLPTQFDDARAREEASRGLLSAQAMFAWAMLVVAFFTVWWPVFLVLLVPVLATTAALSARWVRGPRRRRASRRRKAFVATLLLAVTVVLLLAVKVTAGISWSAFVVLLVPLVVLVAGFLFGWWQSLVGIRLRGTVRMFGLLAAAVFVGILALEPSVWLPLRTITFVGTPPVVKNQPLHKQVAAYVLSRESDSMSLLLESPRAVVQVKLKEVDEAMPLCVPPESSGRVLTLRASQVLGIDPDPHSPYGTCPGMQRKRI